MTVQKMSPVTKNYRYTCISRETDRDRQRQTEIDRDRQRQIETGGERQRQIDRQIDRQKSNILTMLFLDSCIC